MFRSDGGTGSIITTTRKYTLIDDSELRLVIWSADPTLRHDH